MVESLTKYEKEVYKSGMSALRDIEKYWLADNRPARTEWLPSHLVRVFEAYKLMYNRTVSE